jgi:hypothetical protein
MTCPPVLHQRVQVYYDGVPLGTSEGRYHMELPSGILVEQSRGIFNTAKKWHNALLPANDMSHRTQAYEL